MKNPMNLLEQYGVEQTDKYKTLVINKKAKSYPVYRVPLKYLYYNDKNDRISTELVRYISEQKSEIPDRIDKREEYNMVFQELIRKSDEVKLNKTKNSIMKRGQDKPGVTLIDGRVVDGNRRFTCLRLIEKETNIERYFETVILDWEYDQDYKYVKSLEVQLQMGIEKPVDYDPIDRLFGVYNSIRIEKKFTPEEYAELFDNITAADVRRDLELADLMCKYLEFIDSPGKYYIAKDLKLDGVLHEIPAILKKVGKKHPELVDDTESFIFTLITMDVDSKMNLYVRDLKDIVEKADYPKLLEMIKPYVDKTLDAIEQTDINRGIDIAEIRKDDYTKEKLIEAVDQQKAIVTSKVVNDAPIKHLKTASTALDSIFVLSIPEMDSKKIEEARNLIDKIEERLKEIRDHFES